MMNCPACSEETTEDSRFCPSCGEALEQLHATVTKAQPKHSAPGAEKSVRFSPGDVLAGRYRIVLRVGKGGMGEVYRANDLELGQAVALKFLPQDIQEDETRLARFRREVRIARQVAHPNVCRVYDIGQVNQQHFLSMEYIDGEDLGSLLRRIGRLPSDKAIEIARELCAGLAAAHEKGVLHRDLKPSNVMIDGRGKVRLTDFGIASMTGQIDAAEVRHGTPAFMAPEQWSGKEVSIKSDLYSLGLVLYELFTGKRAFSADTAKELIRLHRDTIPRNPSSLVEDLDPAVERVILRCLEKDPDKRPPSALAVAAALPGGDPLAAALAAGETPSPELVAEASDVGALQPAIAWTCLAAVVVQVLLLAWMAGESQLSGLTHLPKPPVLLIDRARQVIRDSGYPTPSQDSSFGFSLQEDYIEYVMENDSSPERWNRVATGERSFIRFWYRQSPHYLIPQRLTSFFATANDPPPLLTDMVKIELDPQGRLRAFDAVAPEFDDARSLGEEPDWSRLFAEAGLDVDDFAPVEPEWNPASYAKRSAAWEGVYPDSAATLIRVEAASYRGRPIAFRIIEPWTTPSRMDFPAADAPGRPTGKVFSPIAAVMHIAANVLAILGGALLARRNLRLGRGDRRGAFRLALYMFSLVMLHWVFGAHHVPESSEVDLFFGALYRAFFTFALAWLFYVALEPYVRRVWPEMMISWIRLLDGRFRDPLVGRHVLMGCMVGALLELVQRAYQFIPTELGYFAPRPDRFGNPNAELISLRGVRSSCAFC
jgi:serine/threonine-protein kinase